MKKRFVFLIILLCIVVLLTAGLVYKRKTSYQSVSDLLDSIKNSAVNLEQSLAYSDYKDFYLHQKKGRISFDTFKQEYENNADYDAFAFLDQADSYFAYNILLLLEMEESKLKQELIKELTLQSQKDNIVLDNYLQNVSSQSKESSISSAVLFRKSQIVRNYIDKLK